MKQTASQLFINLESKLVALGVSLWEGFRASGGGGWGLNQEGWLDSEQL